MPERAIKSLIISVIAAIALYFAAILAAGYQEILEALYRLDLLGISVILALSLVNYGLRFWRWHWFVSCQGHPIPPLLHGSYYLSGFALTTTPGKIGEAIRSRYLKRHGMAYNQSFATFFMERFLDFCTIVLLSTSAVLHFQGYESLMLISLCMMVSALWLLKSGIAGRLLKKLQQRTQNPRLHKTAETLQNFLLSSVALLKGKLLFGGLMIGIVAWAAEGVAFYLILQYLGVESSLWLAVGIYSISVVAGAVSFIPGGLGSTEAVMGLLLLALGADPATAVAATVICRITTLWFAVILGAIAMSWLEIKPPMPLTNNESK